MPDRHLTYCLPFLILLPCELACGQSPAQPAEELAPIVVTAVKKAEESHLVSRSYEAAADVQSSFGTAADLLTAIPSIDVDPDGVISLRGDSNVVILVDGKPSALFQGSKAGDNLNAMPAKDIERIEILTDPPPQYRSEGVAGVINIITKAHRGEGYAGSLQASAGPEGRYEAGFSGSYSRAAFRASLSASYRRDLRHRLQDVQSTTTGGTGDAGTSRSAFNEVIRRVTPPISLALGYDVDEHHTLTFDLTRTGRSGPRDYFQQTQLFSAADTPSAAAARRSLGHDSESDYDTKLGYTQKLAAPGAHVDLAAHVSAGRTRERYDYVDTSLLPPAAASNSFLFFSERKKTTEFNADLVLPWLQNSTLKAGFAFEQNFFGHTSDGGQSTSEGTLVARNPLLTDAFGYHQTVHALYASEDRSLGDWHWLVGARAEWTLTHGEQLALGSDFRYRYLRLFPNAALDYHATDKSTFSLAASRRVTRPDGAYLNPFIDYEYTPNLTSGDPSLHPQYTTTLQTGYAYDSRGLSLTGTLYYRRNTDALTEVTRDLGNGLFLTTKANLPRSVFEGAEFTASGKLDRFSYGLSGNLYRNQIDAGALGAPGLRASTGVNGKLKLDYEATATDSLQVTTSRTDRRLTPQGFIGAITVVAGGYRHRFSQQLNGLITVSDLFDGQRIRRVTSTSSYSEIYERRVRGHIIWIGAVYAFGSTGTKDPALQYDTEP